MPVVVRWLFAFLLLAATFNPTPWNYVRWARENLAGQLPLTVFLGLVLTIGYAILLRATLRGVGAFGMALVAALLASLTWVLVDWRVLTLDNRDETVWFGLFALSVILGIGLSWSIIRRRLSGQVDVEDAHE